ncbi:hypothetical protein G7Y79_00030g064150 [Physcia stellaris]|nr:hypothetical protein G7Y79_00030g064150 [Physcia stellaris]
MLYYRLLLVIQLIAVQSVFSFSLYPTVDQDRLATSFGISIDCLVALNTTVGCDEDLFQWTNAVDDHLWSTENVTDLCTPSCATSAQQWNDNVQDKCADDTIATYGKLVPAQTIAGRFIEGLNLACLQPDSKSSWCLVESQDWVGSDVVRPDCSADPTDPSCTDSANVTAENSRIANLYNDQLLCSDCFLKMFHQRLSSAYLPDQDYSDYLVEQYLDVRDVCTATSLPELTTRGAFNYAAAPTSENATSATAAATTTISSGSPSASCLGQIVDTGLKVTTANATEACKQLSVLYGVSTGDLQQITGGDDCYSPDPVCLPAACSLQAVPAGATCAPGGSYVPPPNPTGDTNAGGQERGGPGGADPTGITGTQTILVTSTPLGQAPTAAPAPTQPGIATDCNSYAKAVTGDSCAKFAQGNNITPQNLYDWNTVLGADGKNCSTQLFADYYYCVGVAGSGSSQTSTTSSSTTTTAPSPTQSGITSFCNKYSETKSGDSCSKFAQDNNISPNDLYTWNPVLGSGGSNCNTQLFADYYYCVGIAPPTPTQAGIASNCNDYAKAVGGDYCSKFAQDHGISVDHLYAWNAVLGSGGSGCDTQFFKDYFYCVGVSG